MTARSLLKRATLSLALGAATTIAVAWGLAMWSPWNEPRRGAAMLAPRGSTISSISVSQAWQPGALVRALRVVGSDGEHNNSWSGGEMPVSFRPVETLSADQVDSTWGFARRAFARSETPLWGVEYANGWPLLALYWKKDRSTTTTGGTLLRISGEDPWGTDFKVLPIIPIWRGFFGNTGAFAAAWSIPLIGPSLVIGRLRRRRGRCPRCGYDLAGQVGAGCSECGWNRGKRP